MYICLCKGLTESKVKQVANCGHTTAETLIEAIGWRDAKCCGRCARSIDNIIELVVEPSVPVSATFAS
jgi:bacterioferritin-associated ferredoxin